MYAADLDMIPNLLVAVLVFKNFRGSSRRPRVTQMHCIVIKSGYDAVDFLCIAAIVDQGEQCLINYAGDILEALI